MTTENGRKIAASDFGGKLLVLNFWATWCPPCVEETPSLSEFAKTMQKDGIVVRGCQHRQEREPLTSASCSRCGPGSRRPAIPRPTIPARSAPSSCPKPT